MVEVLLKTENIIKDYHLPKKKLFEKILTFRILHGIDLEIKKGTGFGIVGESGCGKSTLARIIMALEKPTGGKVYFEGHDLFGISPKELKHLRRHFQMVFQDPYSSLNPRQTVLRIIAEPMDTLPEKVSDQEKRDKVQAILKEVGLNSNDSNKYPHEFSGGQRQRIAIARALITQPSLIVADEAVSALDVSIQAQVLNLMMDLQDKYNLAYLFISHDLSVVEQVTDEIAVLYLGRVVESGKTKNVFANPQHPYTRILINAVPIPDPTKKRAQKKIATEGRPTENRNVGPRPEEIDSEEGCPFRIRCDQATTICFDVIPDLLQKDNRKVACHHA